MPIAETETENVSNLKTKNFYEKLVFAKLEILEKIAKKVRKFFYFCSNFNRFKRKFLIQESPIKSMNFDEKNYEKRSLNEEDTIFWRKIGDEIEFVLRFKTKTWAAIGWRPQSKKFVKFYDFQRKTWGGGIVWRPQSKNFIKF